MRILYVWDAEYPWDVRTEKVCLALSQHGHQVFITARNQKGLPRTVALPEGVVERLPAFPGPFRRWLSFPAFFNPVWIRHISALARRHRVDLILVRDLPLAPTALLASRRRWPVVMDMAEHYPAMIADIWADGRQRFLDGLIRNPRTVERVERSIVGRLDHIITVVEESRQRVIALGVPPGRVSVVSNTPPLSRVTDLRPRTPGDPLRLVYLGLMEHHRGVGDLLDAARLLENRGLHFHLDLVGDGRDLDEFRAQAARLGLDGTRVVFHGRLSHEKALGVVAGGHGGLVPHRATESWNSTIANKLFDYMAAGLAVVTSDAIPSARVVQESGAGLVFRSRDPGNLADQVVRLQDLAAWEGYRLAGQEAVRSRHNWEADTRTLLEVVTRVAARWPGGAAR